MKKFTILEIPLFLPQYQPDMVYGISGIKRENLLDLLYTTTKGYCMYCYCRIKVDSKKFGQLEHAIEKINSDKLYHCVPNIGLSCPICNMSLKKKGIKEEDKRSFFSEKQIEKYENALCKGKECKIECVAYKALKRTYLKRRKIILQPMGVRYKKIVYKIQYNLIKLMFEPSTEFTYTEDEKSFINEHIKRFNLNDSEFRTRELLKFCEDTLNNNKYIKIGRYDNYIVDLFIEKLKKLDNEEINKMCGLIYTIGKSKGII